MCLQRFLELSGGGSDTRRYLREMLYQIKADRGDRKAGPCR